MFGIFLVEEEQRRKREELQLGLDLKEGAWGGGYYLAPLRPGSPGRPGPK